MEIIGIIAGVVFGVIMGGVACWGIRGARAGGEMARQRETHTAAKMTMQQESAATIASLSLEHQRELSGKESEISGLKGQLEQISTAQQLLETAKTQFGEAAKLTASDALKDNSEQFLRLANENLSKSLETASLELHQRHQQFQELVKPLSENYNKLNPQIELLAKQNQSLAAEANKLSTALTDVRQVGNWGEVQLQRVVEIANMTAYSDFREQVTTGTNKDRPDLIVKLPEGRAIVVDAKASIAAALEAGSAPDEEAADDAWMRHAAALKNQVNSLSRKDYGKTVEGSLGFVVMFVPGDQFLAAALKADPSLIDYAMERRVAIATPSSLIAMLWAVANGWQKWEFGKNAEEILAISTEMHDRLIAFVETYGLVRQRLNQTVEAFNKSVGTFEGRVLVSARKMAELRAIDPDTIKPVPLIDTLPRNLDSAGIEPSSYPLGVVACDD